MWGSCRPSLFSCPYDCETPPGPLGPLPSRGAVGSSFLPEKTQIELAWAGPAVGLPFPVISPADAVPMLVPKIATAQAAAASSDFFCKILPPTFGTTVMLVARQEVDPYAGSVTCR
jgi:hypothetical protein